MRERCAAKVHISTERHIADHVVVKKYSIHRARTKKKFWKIDEDTIKAKKRQIAFGPYIE